MQKMGSAAIADQAPSTEEHNWTRQLRGASTICDYDLHKSPGRSVQVPFPQLFRASAGAKESLYRLRLSALQEKALSYRDTIIVCKA